MQNLLGYCWCSFQVSTQACWLPELIKSLNLCRVCHNKLLPFNGSMGVWTGRPTNGPPPTVSICFSVLLLIFSTARGDQGHSRGCAWGMDPSLLLLACPIRFQGFPVLAVFMYKKLTFSSVGDSSQIACG